jgi:hypothetical protein
MKQRALRVKGVVSPCMPVIRRSHSPHCARGLMHQAIAVRLARRCRGEFHHSALQWSVGFAQVANDAGDEARQTGTAASRPAGEIKRYRMLFRKFD